MLYFNRTDGIPASRFWEANTPNCVLNDGTPALVTWVAGGVVGGSHPSENGRIQVLAGSPRGRLQMASFSCRLKNFDESKIKIRVGTETISWFPHETST